MNRPLRLCAVILVSMAVMGCGLVPTSGNLGEFLDKSSAAAIDAVASYCESAVDRDAVRAKLQPEAISEDVELCLKCPGETVTHCVGPKGTKVSDVGT